ncbi:hypothetical protein CBL_00572 [Carabus blaptoides fortunei]
MAVARDVSSVGQRANLETVQYVTDLWLEAVKENQRILQRVKDKAPIPVSLVNPEPVLSGWTNAILHSLSIDVIVLIHNSSLVDTRTDSAQELTVHFGARPNVQSLEVTHMDTFTHCSAQAVVVNTTTCFRYLAYD